MTIDEVMEAVAEYGEQMFEAGAGGSYLPDIDKIRQMVAEYAVTVLMDMH